MKHLSIIAYLLLCCCMASAQIVTPGFTHYTSCPVTYSQVDLCIGWHQPTAGTSDYFNVCAAGTDVGVPQNLLGYQDNMYNAYTGLCTYAPNAFYDYKEYIGTSIAPLTVGHTYTMSITVSLADSSSYATDGLGVFFSTYQLDSPSLYTTLHVTPQIDYSSYGTITDKTNWVTLIKTFVADSAYTSLIVGCFKPLGVLHIDSLASGSNDAVNGRFCYYYIGRIGIPDSINNSIDTIPPQVVITDSVKYIFPTGFTPNGDGLNDVFRITVAPGSVLEGYSLSIFNRFGQRVFFSHDPAAGWDGVFNDVPQEIGAYFYMATITVHSEEKIVKGDLTLVR